MVETIGQIMKSNEMVILTRGDDSMTEYEVINVTMYGEPKEAYSMFSGDKVEIIGEQTISYEGKVLDQYLYNIVGYTPKNGKPFMGLKGNLVLV